VIGMTDELVTLSGVIDDGGNFTLRAADPALERVHAEGSDYRYEVLDAAGEVIDRPSATMRPHRACHPSGLRVTATVWLTDDARKVRLRDAERTLWEHPVQPAPHVEVRLASKPTRESGVTLDVSSDGGSTPTYLRVAWQRDGSDSAIVIAPALPFTTSPHVDLDWAPGGTGHLVVTVGAGVRTASARSEEFALPPLGTYLVLNDPPDGLRVASGASVLASAGVVDRDHPETTQLPTDVEWLVDDRPVMVGLQATLPAMAPGRHTVTVQLRSDPTVARTVVLTVVSDGPGPTEE
jgi:hypothetical protein